MRTQDRVGAGQEVGSELEGLRRGFLDASPSAAKPAKDLPRTGSSRRGFQPGSPTPHREVCPDLPVADERLDVSEVQRRCPVRGTPLGA